MKHISDLNYKLLLLRKLKFWNLSLCFILSVCVCVCARASAHLKLNLRAWRNLYQTHIFVCQFISNIYSTYKLWDSQAFVTLYWIIYDIIFTGTPATHSSLSRTFPMRLIIHGRHPTESTVEGEKMGKLIHLPDSIDDLLRLAGTIVLLDICLQTKHLDDVVFPKKVTRQEPVELSNRGICPHTDHKISQIYKQVQFSLTIIK